MPLCDPGVFPLPEKAWKWIMRLSIPGSSLSHLQSSHGVAPACVGGTDLRVLSLRTETGMSSCLCLCFRVSQQMPSWGVDRTSLLPAGLLHSRQDTWHPWLLHTNHGPCHSNPTYSQWSHAKVGLHHTYPCWQGSPEECQVLGSFDVLRPVRLVTGT